MASGATSRFSGMIHGRLQYLKYRNTALVRESLLEHKRLLQLAPQFVKPLRLTTPVAYRVGGRWAGFVRFFGLGRTPIGNYLLKVGQVIKAGLPMYDRLSRFGSLPPHEIQRVNYNSRHSMPTACPEINMKPRDRFC